MFKQLLAVLKKGDLVNQALDDTQTMLEKANCLFNEAVKGFENNKPAGFDIYELDREINYLEKKIRRKVLEHLSINPQQDIVASLVLTSIVISIERIGDYSKNIYELVDLYDEGDKITIDKQLTESAVFISKTFKEVEKVFASGNAKEAHGIMNKINPVKKGFETYIFEEAATQTGRSTRRTIVNVLYSRYLKRVAAHLETIASGIANPFDMIGFYKGNIRKEAD